MSEFVYFPLIKTKEAGSRTYSSCTENDLFLSWLEHSPEYSTEHLLEHLPELWLRISFNLPKLTQTYPNLPNSLILTQT